MCMNTAGSYECGCADGYFYNRFTNECKDIDECFRQKDDCQDYEKCVNTIGSFDCECLDEFKERGRKFVHGLSVGCPRIFQL